MSKKRAKLCQTKRKTTLTQITTGYNEGRKRWCRRAVLNRPHTELWSRWATAAQDHTQWQSCELRSLRKLRLQFTGLSKTEQEKIGRALISPATHGCWGQNLMYTTLNHDFILPCISDSGCWWCNSVWGKFLWYTLRPLVPSEHHLNTTGNLNTVDEHVHPFRTMYLDAYGWTCDAHLVNKDRNVWGMFGCWIFLVLMVKVAPVHYQLGVPNRMSD